VTDLGMDMKLGPLKKMKDAVVYEYKIIHFGLTAGARKEDIEEKLNAMGRDGWELTVLTRNDYVVMARVVKG